MSAQLIVGIAFALIVLALALPARRKLDALRAYVGRVSTCGNLPPTPTPAAIRRYQWLSRVVQFIQVGRIQVLGRDNLLSTEDPHIVAANHPHYADVAVLPLVLNGECRCPAARGALRFAWGLGALILAPSGAFCVDLRKGRGGPALRASVRVLVNGERLIIFPEGWAHLDGQLGEFKKGTVRIAREAARALGRPAFIVPTFLRYGRYPGPSIRGLPPPVQYLLILLGFLYFRRGVQVVFGEPIPSNVLPQSDAAATELLRDRILALDPGPQQFTRV